MNPGVMISCLIQILEISLHEVEILIMFYNFFMLVFLQVERGHFWSRLLADKTKQHWLKPDFSKWKDEDECSDEDVCTDEDESTDDDESTDEDEDKFKDVDKYTGKPPPEDFAEQMLDEIQAYLDALLRGEWSNRSALLYLGYQELGKIIADEPRPEQEDLGKYNSLVEALDNLQPFVDFLEREGVDSQSSQSERLKEWLTGLGLTGHNLGEERGNLEAIGAFCDNSGRINQPTRHGEVSIYITLLTFIEIIKKFHSTYQYFTFK